MSASPSRNPRLAGLVLALLGAITYGATSAFGLVLCVEWLRDPSRPAHLRRWDWVGLVLAIPGVAFFVWLSISLFDYAPGGTSFAAMIAGYWAFFLAWAFFRRRRLFPR